jgi:glyoxylase-like metal-dependent hydrolase (beta-lactamase superfamily II)
MSSTMTRRTLLRSTGLLAGTALASRVVPADLRAQAKAPAKPLSPAQQKQAGIAYLNQRRAEMARTPIQRTKLTDTLELLSGPGGNVVVLHGADGLVLVDTFVRGAFPALETTLDAIGGQLTLAIDTHWHFDHADNNALVHQAGATIVAHANTKKRLSEPHDILGMHMDPEPAAALPTVTFKDSHQLKANGEDVVLQYFDPAHTDTDVVVLFNHANVLHMGDTFFNGSYPFIDVATGGNINGMIAAAERALGIIDGNTKVVPGHGPLGDRAALATYRRVIATIRDRVGKLKASGKSLEEVQAAKPSAEFDAQWGAGFTNPEVFVGIVYNTVS